MIRVLLLPLLILPSTLSAPSPLFEKAKALVLISFDGFRFDTLNSTIAPNITSWAAEGVLFKNGVQPQASTVTAPNHYSIVTGLYEDAHGIVGNIFFDAERRKFYDIYNLSSIPGTIEESLNPYWYTSETIWQSNRKAGGHSAVVHWPIGDVASGNDNETSFHAWREHGNLSKWQDEVEVVIDSLLEGKNLVAWYISEPDHTLHTQGFYHDGHFRRVMADLDVTFGYFLNRLKTLELYNTTDIIFTADHGHAEIRSLDVVLCMDEYIKGQIGVDYQVSDYTVLAYTEQQAIEVFESLTKAVAEKQIPAKVMWTKDVPAEWHFSHPSRLGQVMVLPEIGTDARFKCPWKDPATFHSSTHGHAPEKKEMRAVLAMRGPSFAEKREIDSIPQNIDIFPLMGKILGVPIPANNGTLERVELALRSPPSTEDTVEDPQLMNSNIARIFNILLILMPIAVLSIILYYIIMRVRRGPNKQLAADLTNEATEPML
ncbi:hypothetical protein PMAYCL1PPCAC_20779 [Pristionchus mayeri]|uniref:AP3A hydrolase n=1 Tax=Pristionchus mayeri TaxID=1317129 RepID=A0AAN5CU04_9BILA|nr:hypothetical protein PMAYCL1PPCAC_20779 [Pristionchus mayeri]